jgi:hypothetical protein
MARNELTLRGESYDLASRVTELVDAPNIEVGVGFALAFTVELMSRLKAEKGSTLLIRTPNGKVHELNIKFDWAAIADGDGLHRIH